MNKKIILLLNIALLQTGIVLSAFGQQPYRPNYPSGIYQTKEDFISLTPSAFDEIYADGYEETNWDNPDSIINELFFRYKNTDKKVRKAFAISYKGFLFIRNTQLILPRNTAKKDKGQTLYDYNAFSRVLKGGENFLYIEAEMKSSWANAVLVNLGAGGGMAAGNLDRLKGVVWDFKRREFNILRNCKDLNEFLSEYFPTGLMECVTKKYDILRVRSLMEKTK